MTDLEKIELERKIKSARYGSEYKYCLYEIYRDNDEDQKEAEAQYRQFEAHINAASALYAFASAICPLDSISIDKRVNIWLGIEPKEIKKAAIHQVKADFKNGLFKRSNIRKSKLEYYLKYYDHNSLIF